VVEGLPTFVQVEKLLADLVRQSVVLHAVFDQWAEPPSLRAARPGVDCVHHRCKISLATRVGAEDRPGVRTTQKTQLRYRKEIAILHR